VPKVLGVTASPGETEDEVLELCDLYEAQLVTPSERISSEHAPKANLEVIEVECPSSWQRLSCRIPTLMKKCQRSQDSQDSHLIGKLQELSCFTRVLGLGHFRRLQKYFTGQKEGEEFERALNMLFETDGAIDSSVHCSPVFKTLVDLLKNAMRDSAGECKVWQIIVLVISFKYIHLSFTTSLRYSC
jgi:hypothetical protein